MLFKAIAILYNLSTFLKSFVAIKSVTTAKDLSAQLSVLFALILAKAFSNMSRFLFPSHFDLTNKFQQFEILFPLEMIFNWMSQFIKQFAVFTRVIFFCICHKRFFSILTFLATLNIHVTQTIVHYAKYCGHQQQKQKINYLFTLQM